MFRLSIPTPGSRTTWWCGLSTRPTSASTWTRPCWGSRAAWVTRTASSTAAAGPRSHSRSWTGRAPTSRGSCPGRDHGREAIPRDNQGDRQRDQEASWRSQWSVCIHSRGAGDSFTILKYLLKIYVSIFFNQCNFPLLIYKFLKSRQARSWAEKQGVCGVHQEVLKHIEGEF